MIYVDMNLNVTVDSFVHIKSCVLILWWYTCCGGLFIIRRGRFLWLWYDNHDVGLIWINIEMGES